MKDAEKSIFGNEKSFAIRSTNRGLDGHLQ